MSEVITLLSSDEEESPPPRKRIKPTLVDEVTLAPVQVNKPNENSEDIVILSDEDDNVPEKTICRLSQEITRKSINLSEIVKDDDNDSITFIDEKNTIDDNSKHIESCSIKQNGGENGCEDKAKKDIIFDENNSEESSGKENKCLSNKISQNNNGNEPSTSKRPADLVLENFLTICEENINNSQYEDLKYKQFPQIRKYYRKFGSKLSESSNFIKLIEENMIRAKKSPATAVISFNEVFQYIKELINSESIEVSEEHRIKLKKLEKTIRLLINKIKYLENAEINFDEEEDSTYLKLDRYTNRLNKVYKKYCQLLEKNPYSGRITYEKLDFVDSEYNEINRAINKKYKNNKKFPSYLEMEKFIKNIVTQNKLGLSENKIKSESVRCFKKLGELLQSRRKKELYDSHYVYIRDNEDPAVKDSTLMATLKQNFTESQIKIEKICEEFVMKEEHGEEAELSEEDSDKSNYVDSENDDKDEN